MEDLSCTEKYDNAFATQPYNTRQVMGNMNKSEYIITYSLFVAYTQICKNKTVEYLLIC